MEFGCLCSLSALVLMLFSGTTCRSQEIEVSFNFQDNGLIYEVIFVGQEDVSLICLIKGVTNASITIRHPNGTAVAANNGNNNCVEYNIIRVVATDGGAYTCTVEYFDNITREEERDLDVNVQDDEQACFRNGTAGTAYKVGDVLLLSCYCNNIEKCEWIQSVVGSELGQVVTARNKYKVGGISVLKVKVGPLTLNDLLLRYDCAHDSGIMERCSIGPAEESEGDDVRNPSASSDLLSACPEQNISSTPPPNTVSVTKGINVNNVNNDNGNGDNGDDILLYIIVAGIALIILCLAVLAIFLASRLKRNRKVKTVEEPRNQFPNHGQDSSHRNVGYDAADYAAIDKNRMAAFDPQGVFDNDDDRNQLRHGDVMNDTDVRRMSIVAEMSQHGEIMAGRIRKASLRTHDESNDQFRHGDVMTDIDPRQSIIAEIRQRGAVVADRIRRASQMSQDDVTQYGTQRDLYDMSQYGTVAVERVEEADEFISGDVTEYKVPLAFTASTYSDVIRSHDNPRIVLSNDL